MSGKPLDCPFCASDDLEVVAIDQDRDALAVRCKECGATGPSSLFGDPEQAVFAWNERQGRLSVVN